MSYKLWRPDLIQLRHFVLLEVRYRFGKTSIEGKRSRERQRTTISSEKMKKLFN